jgi:hypothetical protein
MAKRINTASSAAIGQTKTKTLSADPWLSLPKSATKMTQLPLPAASFPRCLSYPLEVRNIREKIEVEQWEYHISIFFREQWNTHEK